MARRAGTDTILPEIDRLDAVMENDKEGAANELENVLNDIGSVTGAGVTVIVYKRGQSGPWEHVKELTPPINTAELIEELKRDYGGGRYMFRFRAGGRIKGGKEISLAVPKANVIATPKSDDGIIAMMMGMMQMQAQAQQQSADRQMQMMQTMQSSTNTLLGAILPAMMGGRDTPASMIAALSPLMGDKNKGGMLETVEMIRLIKDILPSGDSGSDENGLQSALRAFAPVMAAGASQMLNNPQPQRQAVAYTPSTQPATMLPQQAPITSGDPILAVIGDDLRYFASRMIDPEVTADALAELLERSGIKQDEFLALVTRLSVGNWIENLYAEGIDLRGKDEWAGRVLQLLSDSFPGGDGIQHPGGDSGGKTNPGHDGDPGEAGGT